MWGEEGQTCSGTGSWSEEGPTSNGAGTRSEEDPTSNGTGFPASMLRCAGRAGIQEVGKKPWHLCHQDGRRRSKRQRQGRNSCEGYKDPDQEDTDAGRKGNRVAALGASVCERAKVHARSQRSRRGHGDEEPLNPTSKGFIISARRQRIMATGFWKKEKHQAPPSASWEEPQLQKMPMSGSRWKERR